MTYDALGRRRIKAVNGERTFFHWDGDALLSEQFEDQAPREYVYYPGTFEPLAIIENGNIFYYNNDVNGLPQELTKPNGEIVWSASYDAMGRVDQLLVEEVDQPLRFQGQYWDAEIDLCYNRYRYFDPQIGAFISQDPLGLAAGENVYAYAPNVWGWVDPLGLKCENSAGTATVYWHDNRGPGNAFGRYSVETSTGSKTIHTHQLGTPGTDTMISTDLGGVVSPTKSHTFDLPNAKAAQEFQLQNLNKTGPPYDTKTRSCVTHVGEVLRAGGLDVPTNPGGQFKYLKKSGL
jgi:RHS repeat-associated protein